MPPHNLNKYPEVNADALLAKVFDFGTFMNLTKLHNIMAGYKNTSKNYDMRILKHYMDNVATAFYDKADRDAEMFLIYASDALFKTGFDHSMIPYFSNEFQQAFNATNTSQVEALHDAIEKLVMAVEPTQLFDPKTAQGKDNAIKIKADSFFQFGETFYHKTSDFKAQEFKNKLSPQVLESFFPFFFYRYLNEKLSICPDANMQCKRLYKLAKYVFMYYSLMSVFLAIFAKAEDTVRYKESNNEDDIVVNEKRQRIVYIMDSILIKMNDADMQDSGMSSDVATFYTNIKRMSMENIRSSNTLVEKKRDVDSLQNNLANYNNMQSLNQASMVSARFSFVVNLVAWSLVVMVIVMSTIAGGVKYMWTDVVIVLSLLVIVLYWTGLFTWMLRFSSENLKTFFSNSKKG